MLASRKKWNSHNVVQSAAAALDRLKKTQTPAEPTKEYTIVRELASTIQTCLNDGYSWEQIAASLSSDLNISPATLEKTYRDYVRHRRRTDVPPVPRERKTPSSASTSGSSKKIQLSPREREVLQYYARRSTGSRIAAALKIRENTVDWHRKNVLNKLDVKTLEDAIAKARKLGLITV